MFTELTQSYLVLTIFAVAIVVFIAVVWAMNAMLGNGDDHHKPSHQ